LLRSQTHLAAVVKLVYTRRSGRRALTGVEVRLLSAALCPTVARTRRPSRPVGVGVASASD
jgi:hypothetical protein